MTLTLPCNSQFESKMIRGLPKLPENPPENRGASPLPGSFLVPRSMAGKDVSWFVLCSKVDFSRKFGTLQNIDLLQLPQIFKLNLANKKDQVPFGSNRDNVNSGQYCTKNKQAPPRTPHWSSTSITVLVYNAVGLSRNPQNFWILDPAPMNCGKRLP